MTSQNDDKENSGHIKAAYIAGIFGIVGICITGLFAVFNTLIDKGIITLNANNTPVIQVTLTEAPTLSPSQVELKVYANQGWQNSGVSVNKGDSIVIEYVSDLWFTDDPNGGRDASGAPNKWTCNLPECHEPLHDFPKFALIGKIGNAVDFLKVGNYLEFEASNSGTLYLRPNYGDEDIAFFNPAGAILVKVIVR
jgi:hypothetical protein